MKLSILPVIAISCLSFVQVSAVAAPGANNESKDQIMVVERSGKPPFKRTFAEATTVDVAQFETVGSGECEEVKTVKMRGKPPFQRSTECVNVVDVAQFELTDEQAKTNFSGRPPFKRH